jgi:hypothetical protein
MSVDVLPERAGSRPNGGRRRVRRLQGDKLRFEVLAFGGNTSVAARRWA